jgi:hypothetical protein
MARSGPSIRAAKRVVDQMLLGGLADAPGKRGDHRPTGRSPGVHSTQHEASIWSSLAPRSASKTPRWDVPGSRGEPQRRGLPGRARRGGCPAPACHDTPHGCFCCRRQNGDSSGEGEEPEEVHQALQAPSVRPQDYCGGEQGQEGTAAGGWRQRRASGGAGGQHDGRRLGCGAPPAPRAPPTVPLASLHLLLALLQESWRRPKGIDSRVRRKFKGCGVIMPNIGYGTNKKTRHTLPNGAPAPPARPPPQLAPPSAAAVRAMGLQPEWQAGSRSDRSWLAGTPVQPVGDAGCLAGAGPRRHDL